MRKGRKEAVKAVERALEGVEHDVGEAVERRIFFSVPSRRILSGRLFRVPLWNRLTFQLLSAMCFANNLLRSTPYKSFDVFPARLGMEFGTLSKSFSPCLLRTRVHSISEKGQIPS